MRLRFIPDAPGEGQSLAYFVVVLQVKPPLHVRIADPRVADAPAVTARPAGFERLEALEHVGAEVVALRIRSVPGILNLDARAHGVKAVHVIEI